MCLLSCRWPRELLVEKALTLQEKMDQEKRNMERMIEDIDKRSGRRQHTKLSERIGQLKKWVMEKRELSGVTADETFVCPKPQNRQSGDIESEIGSWLNMKIHMAGKTDPKAQKSREKAILLLNGPIAEILGRSGDNWWLNEKYHVGRPRKIQTEIQQCSKPRRKRKSMRYSIPDNSAPISVKTASIKSSRGRQVKSARLSDYAYS